MRHTGSASCRTVRWLAASWQDPADPSQSQRHATAATAGQVALAWLLARSRAILPIPGTASVTHLEEN
ncbi:aldo/keto reductase, partial [Streptomyces sp. NPDC048425]